MKKIENYTLPASTSGRVDFPSFPFIQAYPFIREVFKSADYTVSFQDKFGMYTPLNCFRLIIMPLKSKVKLLFTLSDSKVPI